MFSILNEFRAFHILPESIRKNIKSFNILHIDFGVCVTNDDKVYAFGKYCNECFGYFNDNIDNNYVLMSELSHQNINHFFFDGFSMFAISVDNKIFSSGWNMFCQLARGHRSRFDQYLKPERIEFFDNMKIMDIAFGIYHCLALSAEGLVYGWGDNDEGQFDEKGDKKRFLTPVLIDSEFGVNEKVKHIHCCKHTSVLVTVHGHLYILNPEKYQLKHKLAQLSDVHKVFLNESCALVLKNNGFVYSFGKKIRGKAIKFCFKNLNKSQYFSNKLMVPTKKGIHTICTEYGSVTFAKNKNIFEYCLFYFQKTFKTIHLKENSICFKGLEFNENSNSDQILFDSMKTIYSDFNSFYQKFYKFSKFHDLTQFSVFNAFPQILDSSVKYYHQMGEYFSDKYSAIFVMNNNKVYGIGCNNGGELGLGHTSEVREYTLIKQLCDQNIEEFFEGNKFMFARTNDNKIFSWGENEQAQLARGYTSKWNQYLIPDKSLYLEKENIIEISCGSKHSLGLSSDGVLFGWGYNGWGETGSRSDKHAENIPIKVKLGEDSLDNRITFIQCHNCTSCAVTIDGTAYLWGNINQTKTLIPKLINTNVSKMCLNFDTKVSILTFNGKIRFYERKDMKQIEFENKSNDRVTDIYGWNDVVVIQQEDAVYQVYEKIYKKMKTNFSNFYEYFLYKHNRIVGTIHMTRDGYLMQQTIELNDENSNKKLLTKGFQNFFDQKFEDSFDQLGQIGRGAFGCVFHVKSKTTNHVFAVKRMQISRDLMKNIEEIRIMCQLDSDFVVKYYNSWSEGKVINKKICIFVYIQMELCSQNLKTFIELINNFDEKFKTIKYFIRSQLLVEIIECLNHLHSSKPPIIHRDLKPQNILVTDGTNGRFLKLCDFGLSKIYENPKNSRVVGTKEYMAPENFDEDFYDSTNNNRNDYNLKSLDIYSLGVIATNIFDFNDCIERIKNLEPLYLGYYSNKDLTEKFTNVYKVISLMLSKRPEERLSCSELLDKTHEWTVDTKTLKSDEYFNEFKELLEENNDLKHLKLFMNLKLDPSQIVNKLQNTSEQPKTIRIFDAIREDYPHLVEQILTQLYLSQTFVLTHEQASIEEILEIYKDFITVCRYYIREKELEQIEEFNFDELDHEVYLTLMPSFRKLYIPRKTTLNGSCFFNAISLLLFKSEDYSNTIRLLTFDTFFRLRKEFTQYCERIGEDFSKILFKISLIYEPTLEMEKIFKISNNWAEDPSIIATHIAIGRPFFIFGGFIDKRKTVVINENVDGIDCNTTVNNSNFGSFHQHLSMYNCEQLSVQFSEGCPGTTSSQCVNLFSDNRPICLHLSDNHFTALFPKTNFDPFIPTNMSPNPDFLDCFDVQDGDIYQSPFVIEKMSNQE